MTPKNSGLAETLRENVEDRFAAQTLSADFLKNPAFLRPPCSTAKRAGCISPASDEKGGNEAG